MITFPNSKINIGLNIIEKRPDGFHNIESVFYPIPLTDCLEIIDNNNWQEGQSPISFQSSGLTIPGSDNENLCVRAYNLIGQDYQLPPIIVHLHKVIPIGAGLGGGSSDAAFFIKLLNKKFEIGLAFGEMHHYARQLGSDCSFFINNKPAFATGRGELLENYDLDLSGKYLVLINPGIHISTRDAYEGSMPSKPESSLEDLLAQPIEKWKLTVFNDFEKTIFKKFPEIENIKQKLYEAGANFSLMTGSGSSVFGLFDFEPDLKNSFDSCFYWQSKL